MIYSKYLIIILTAMLFLGIVYRYSGDNGVKRLLQVMAIVMAAAGLYCHYEAMNNGEYHRFSLLVAEHVVKAVQGFGRTFFGRPVIGAVRFIQKHDWALSVLTALIFIGVCVAPYRKRGK